MSDPRPRGKLPAREPRVPVVGFGYDPERGPHHFALVVGKQSVTLAERFGRPSGEAVGGDGSAGDEAPTEAPKATLTRYLWDRIKEPAAAEFNRRLLADGGKKGTWASGETLLAPHFGKELALLAWAVEDADADPTLVPSMVANWTGLAPEERWWFYTTINAAIAVPRGRERGWRKAIKIAFAENPVDLPPSALLVGPMEHPPDKPSRSRRATPAHDRGQLGLGLPIGDRQP